MTARTATVVVTDAQVELFRRASGDENPLHVDVDYARRTPFGTPVVYGALGSLVALAAVEPQPDHVLTGVRATFDGPLFAGQTYRRAVEHAGAGDLLVTLHDGGRRVLEVVASFTPDRPGGDPDAGPPQPRPVADPPMADLAVGQQVGSGFRPDVDALRRLLDDLDLSRRGVDLVTGSVLAWISHVVGMEVPGRSAMLSSLDVRLTPAPPAAPPALATRAEVTAVDTGFRLIRLAGDATGGGRTAQVEVQAFSRGTPPASSPDRLDTLFAASGAGDLTGRTALVVGGSRGLGAALVQGLARRGATVHLGFHRSAEDAAATRAALGLDAERVHLLPGDAADPSWCDATQARLAATGASPDILVLNACPPLLRLDLDPAGRERAAEHVGHALALVQAPLAAWAAEVAAATGTVVAVSSAFVSDPPPGWSHYVAAKAAIEGLMSAAAVEHPGAAYLVVRPPRLDTALTATPLGAVRSAPVEPVAAAVVRSLAAPLPAGQVTRLDPDDLVEPPAGRTEVDDSAPRGRVVLAGTFTLDPLVEVTQSLCDELVLGLDVEVAPYGQLFQQLLDPTSELGSNRRGVNVAVVRLADWPGGREGRRLADDLVAAVEAQARRSPVPLLVAFTPAPATTAHVRSLELAQLEASVTEALGDRPGVHVLPSADWVRGWHVDAPDDATRQEMAHVPYTADACDALAATLVRAVHALVAPAAKVLVLDCDNTLWAGLCAEDGPDGVEVTAAHRHLQEWAVELHDRGVLVCLCSKNEPADVDATFAAQTHMPLRPEHVVARQIGWGAKADGLATLADELGLALDSFVFLDDNPVEVAAVQAARPEVLALMLPADPGDTPGFLTRLWALDRLEVGEADRDRTAQYRMRRQREELQRSAATFADFVAGLGLEVHVADARPEHVGRVAQLTQRTNQFNLSGRRRTEPELRTALDGHELRCHVVHVRDRFGDHGLVGAALTYRDGARLVVDTLVMSCRVLGRGVEHALLAALGAEAVTDGAAVVELPYVPTERNTPVRLFLDALAGSDAAEARATYRLSAPDAAAVRFRPEEVDEVGPPGPPDGSGGDNSAPSVPGATGGQRHAMLTALAADATDVAALRRVLGLAPHPAQLPASPPAPLATALAAATPAAPADVATPTALAGGATEALPLVRDVVAGVAGWARDELHATTTLDALRLSSMAVVDATVALEQRLGPLPRTLFFEHRTLGDLASALPAASGTAPATSPPTEPPAPVAATPPGTRSAVVPARSRREAPEVDGVAVVGLAGRYPGARMLDELWDVLAGGRSTVVELRDQRWDHARHLDPDGDAASTYSAWAGLIDGVDEFDPLFFGISPREAELIDPQQRLFLQAAYEAVQDAGHTPANLGRDVGVWVGAMAHDYGLFSAEGALDGDAPYPCAELYQIANRVSYLFDLTGPSQVVDTACSSSGVALHEACEAIRRGSVSAAIAGGVNLVLHPARHVQYAQMGMLSRRGRCAAFGVDADGFVIGEGVGAVLLEPVARALDERHHIYGVIRGSASNTDGRTSGFTVPAPGTQAEVIGAALRRGGVDPSTVTYVEAHGSGTALGDPIEIRGLDTAFASDEARSRPCKVGSVKSNLGHLEPAAAIAGLTKVLLQMEHTTLAPSLHADPPSPDLGLDGTPFRIAQVAEPWTAGDMPRRAGLSSFGAGGVNAHLVVEEWPDPPAPSVGDDTDAGGSELVVDVDATGPELVALSAADDDRLRDIARDLAATLTTRPELRRADVAHTLRVGREPLEVRAAFVAATRTDLVATLRALAEGSAGAPGAYYGRVDARGPGAVLAGSDAATRVLTEAAAAGELHTLARLWVAGVDCDWEQLLPAAGRRRVNLPTYPFRRDRYWMPGRRPPTTAPAAATTGVTTVGDQIDGLPPLYSAAWHPIGIPPARGSLSHVVVIDPRGRRTSGAGSGLLAGVEQATVVHDAGEAMALVGGLDPGGPGVVVVEDRRGSLAAGDGSKGLEQAGPTSPAAAAGLNSRAGLGTAVALARLAARPGGPRITYVSVTLPEIDDPSSAAVAGFARSLVQETSRFRATRVEVADGEEPEMAELVAAAASGASELRRFPGGWAAPRFTPVATIDSADLPPPVRRGGVVLITGGAGAVGAAIARHLADRCHATLVLVGRRPADASVEAVLADLRSRGAVSARYLQGDVTDPGDLARLVVEARPAGGLHGVVHAAGVVDDARLVDKSDDAFGRVLAVKEAALALDELTADDPLDLFCLMSSFVGTLGNAGQSDYAAGNRLLDSLARSRDAQVRAGRRWGRSRSIAWPLWAEGGMRMPEPVVELTATTVGLRPLPAATALRALDAAVAADAPAVLVGHGDTARLERSLAATAGTLANPAAVPANVTPATSLDRASGGSVAAITDFPDAGTVPPAERDIGTTPDVVPQVERWLVGEAAALAKLDPARVDPHRELGSYGFDSVLLTALANRINQVLDLALTPVVLFEHPSSAALAAHLGAEHRPAVEAWRARTAVIAGPVPVGSSNGPTVERESRDETGGRERGAGGEAIAIVGLAGRFPGAADAGELWVNVAAGHRLVSEVPADRWDWHAIDGDPRRDANTTDCHVGGFLDDVDAFDAVHFGISPREAHLMDPQQRLFLEASWHAVEDAGYDPRRLAGTVTGVFVGVTLGDYLELLLASEPEIGAHTVTGNVHAVVANRVSHVLDLRGPSEAVDAACASSLVALHRAIRALRDGECDQAIVGGVNVMLSPTWFVSLSRAGMLSPTGCHTFDRRADGYARGEGVGAVVLKPLRRAEADGDTVRAVVRGSATNHGGRAQSLTAPNPAAQAAVVAAAHRDAGVVPGSVGFVETHGTGTELGDPIEVRGLQQAFTGSRRGAPCVLGALKASIGHLESAAGIAGLVSTVSAMQHRTLPPVPGLESPNPYLDLDDGRFRLLHQAEPWPAPTGPDGTVQPRRAGVSSFGFGGTNAHVVLEEAPIVASPGDDGRPHLVVLSAPTPAQLATVVADLRDRLSGPHAPPALADLAHTSQVGRTACSHRAAFVVTSHDELRQLLAAWPTSTGVRSDQEGGDGTHPDRAGADTLAALADRWQAGGTIDWETLALEPGARRVPFPLLPFARTRHGLLSATTAALRRRAAAETDTTSVVRSNGQSGTNGGSDQPRRRGQVDDGGLAPRLFARRWRPVASVPSGPPPAGTVVVVVDASIYLDVAAALPGDAATRWVLVREPSLLPGLGPNDHELDLGDLTAGRDLGEHLLAAHDDLVALVDLVDVGIGAPPLGREQGRLGLLQALATGGPASGHRPVVHIRPGAPTSGQPVEPGARHAGLVRAVGAEHAGLRTTTVALDDPTPAAAVAIALAELARPDHEPELRVAGGAVEAPTWVEVGLDDEDGNPSEELSDGERHWVSIDGAAGSPGRLGAVPIRPDRPYLVTGGTGGLGLAAAELLVARGARRLALCGRRSVPPREDWDHELAAGGERAGVVGAVRRLEEAGAEVVLHHGSLADRDALGVFLDGVRARFGPVAGVLHAAGWMSQAAPAFARKTADELEATGTPKGEGLLTLLDLVAGDEPDVVVHWSSLSAAVPDLAVGLTAYAGANAVLDAVAEAAHGQPGRTRHVSIAWGSWTGLGMGEVTSPRYTERGFGALARDEGLDLLDRALSAGEPVLVAARARPDALDHSVTPIATRGAVTCDDDRAQLVVAARSLVGEVLARETMIPREEIDDGAPFAELGVDSILVAGIVGQLEPLAGTALDPSIVLQHPSVARLADHLVAVHGASLATHLGLTGRREQARPASDAGRAAVPAVPAAVPAVPGSVPAAGTAKLPALAVVGMAGRYPGAPDLDAYWDLLAAGRSAVREVPTDRWDAAALYSVEPAPGRTTSRWGGFLDGIEDFDPDLFGIAETDAAHVDPVVRLVLECTEQAFRHAGYERSELQGHRIGVYAGAATSNYGERIRTPGRATATGLNQNFVAAQAAQVYDLTGPNLAVDTACSSALSALHLAQQGLALGECEMALVAGADLLLDEVPFLKMSAARALSPDGTCHVFDVAANGIVLGEGAGAVLVRPLDDALAAGDAVLAVVEACAVNNDGRTMGLTTPNPDAQERLVRDALAKAGVDAASISYVEAHGTGTMIGDPIELQALTRAFRRDTPESGFCAVGSVKSNLGHLLMASGMASLHKVVLSLVHRRLPPTLHCETPNPRFAFDESPFMPNTTLRPWEERHGVRRAGISAFGFGGANAHVVLRGPTTDELARRAGPGRRPLAPTVMRRRRFWVDRPDRPDRPSAGAHPRPALLDLHPDQPAVARTPAPTGPSRRRPILTLERS